MAAKLWTAVWLGTLLLTTCLAQAKSFECSAHAMGISFQLSASAADSSEMIELKNVSLELNGARATFVRLPSNPNYSSAKYEGRNQFELSSPDLLKSGCAKHWLLTPKLPQQSTFVAIYKSGSCREPLPGDTLKLSCRSDL